MERGQERTQVVHLEAILGEITAASMCGSEGEENWNIREILRMVSGWTWRGTEVRVRKGKCRARGWAVAPLSEYGPVKELARKLCVQY